MTREQAQISDLERLRSPDFAQICNTGGPSLRVSDTFGQLKMGQSGQLEPDRRAGGPRVKCYVVTSKAAHYTRSSQGFDTGMVVERVAPTASRCPSNAQNQPFQSHRPEQIEVFQPFHHVRPVVCQHVAEFDFADVGTTILPVAISCYCFP